MINETYQEWHEANQSYLMAALESVRLKLIQNTDLDQQKPDAKSRDEKIAQALKAAESALPAPAALDTLCRAFDLSNFERNLLLLCTGM